MLQLRIDFLCYSFCFAFEFGPKDLLVLGSDLFILTANLITFQIRSTFFLCLGRYKGEDCSYASWIFTTSVMTSLMDGR